MTLMQNTRKELAAIAESVAQASDDSRNTIDFQAVADAVVKRVLEMQASAVRYDNQFGQRLLAELNKEPS